MATDDALDLYGNGSIYPSLPGHLQEAFTVEDDVDKAFVDGIIAMSEGSYDLNGRGMAYRTGNEFAARWGERGKDLGLALKQMREDAGKMPLGPP